MRVLKCAEHRGPGAEVLPNRALEMPCGHAPRWQRRPTGFAAWAQGMKITTSDGQTLLGSVKRFNRFGLVAGQGAAGSLQQGLVTLDLEPGLLRWS